MRLKVNKGKGGDEVLPVLWEDNYVSLLPGEKREIERELPGGGPGGQAAGGGAAGLEPRVAR